MVGVCMTVISIVKLSQRARVSHYVDEALAIDGVIFLASVLLSYLSIRSPTMERRLEVFADDDPLTVEGLSGGGNDYATFCS